MPTVAYAISDDDSDSELVGLTLTSPRLYGKGSMTRADLPDSLRSTGTLRRFLGADQAEVALRAGVSARALKDEAAETALKNEAAEGALKDEAAESGLMHGSAANGTGAKSNSSALKTGAGASAAGAEAEAPAMDPRGLPIDLDQAGPSNAADAEHSALSDSGELL